MVVFQIGFTFFNVYSNVFFNLYNLLLQLFTIGFGRVQRLKTVVEKVDFAVLRAHDRFPCKFSFSYARKPCYNKVSKPFWMWSKAVRKD